MSRRKKQCEWGEHIYAAAPSKVHPGYIATACLKCGKFLGRCPTENFQPYSPGAAAPGGRYAKDRPALHVEQRVSHKAKRSEKKLF